MQQRTYPCLGAPEPCKRTATHQGPRILALVVIAAISLGCLQGLRWLSRGYDAADAAIQAARANQAFSPAEITFLGRNYNQRILNAQLREKEQEVQYLRTQLESALRDSRRREDSVKAAEDVILALREREEAAKTSRSKAQLALAEKASALQTCQVQAETLLAEVTQCSKALRRL